MIHKGQGQNIFARTRWFHVERFNGYRMKQLLSLLLASTCVLCGCRKKPVSPPETVAEDVTPAPEATPAPVPPASAAPAPAKANMTSTGRFTYVPGTTELDDLNKHLTWYVVSKNRFPASVDELLTANRLPRPVLPPGGRLIINQKTKTVDYIGPN